MASMVPNFLQRLTKPSVTNEPPNPSEVWRNDIFMIATLLFALFLGYGIRGQAFSTSQSVSTGEGLPTIDVPDRWLTQQVDSSFFQVRNPASASSFDSEIDVVTTPISDSIGLVQNLVTDQQKLEAARLNWSLGRSKNLENYRELESRGVTVRPTIGRSRAEERPAMLTTYAYIADPSLESGANGLPVVVQAQDLLFLQGESVVVVTLATDATAWTKESVNFDKVLDSLRLKEQEQTIQAPARAADAAVPGIETGEVAPSDASPAVEQAPTETGTNQTTNQTQQQEQNSASDHGSGK